MKALVSHAICEIRATHELQRRPPARELDHRIQHRVVEAAIQQQRKALQWRVLRNPVQQRAPLVLPVVEEAACGQVCWLSGRLSDSMGAGYPSYLLARHLPQLRTWLPAELTTGGQDAQDAEVARRGATVQLMNTGQQPAWHGQRHRQVHQPAQPPARRQRLRCRLLICRPLVTHIIGRICRATADQQLVQARQLSQLLRRRKVMRCKPLHPWKHEACTSGLACWGARHTCSTLQAAQLTSWVRPASGASSAPMPATCSSVPLIESWRDSGLVSADRPAGMLWHPSTARLHRPPARLGSTAGASGGEG